MHKIGFSIRSRVVVPVTYNLTILRPSFLPFFLLYFLPFLISFYIPSLLPFFIYKIFRKSISILLNLSLEFWNIQNISEEHRFTVPYLHKSVVQTAITMNIWPWYKKI